MLPRTYGGADCVIAAQKRLLESPFRRNPLPEVVVGCRVRLLGRWVFGFGGFFLAGFSFVVDEISTPCVHETSRHTGDISLWDQIRLDFHYGNIFVVLLVCCRYRCCVGTCLMKGALVCQSL
jgi:hypothetical protein